MIPDLFYTLSLFELIGAIAGALVVITLCIIAIDSLQFLIAQKYLITVSSNSFNTAWTLGVVCIFYFAYTISTNTYLPWLLVVIGTVVSGFGFSPFDSSEKPSSNLLADPHDME